MNEKKFQLTSEEQRIVVDSGFFYTRQRIINKVFELFGELSREYEALLKQSPLSVSPLIFSARPKISRGENYLQLPYVMLDYPRHFKTEETFAIRSLFWWGKHFSIHLVLGGSYAKQFEQRIGEEFKNSSSGQWYYSFTDDPWQHHFETDNYLPLQNFERGNGNYLKLGKKLSLENWNEAEDFYLRSFTELINILQ